MTVSEVGRERPYLDPARPVDERVDDLLGRLTREERVAQLGSRWVWELADSEGRLRPESGALLRDGLGHVTRIAGASSLRPAQAAELANTIQRTLVEETRLGIPAIVHEEICSGLMARDATVFPQAIGLASTWEPALVEELADAVRTQMRASGAHQFPFTERSTSAPTIAGCSWQDPPAAAFSSSTLSLASFASVKACCARANCPTPP